MLWCTTNRSVVYNCDRSQPEHGTVFIDRINPTCITSAKNLNLGGKVIFFECYPQCGISSHISFSSSLRLRFNPDTSFFNLLDKGQRYLI